MKFNPFRPNSIVGPGMFSGRLNEVEAIEKSLNQTRHSNPRHFLIEGEKGIGKSSLLFYIQAVGEGRISMPDNMSFKFLVLSVELSEGLTCHEIIRKIAIELKTQVRNRHDLEQIVKTAWDFLSNWSILGVEYKKDAGARDPTEVTEELASTMKDIIVTANNKLDAAKQLDGILVLIDEADKPDATARLGEFVKLFTERLTKIGCDQVCLGLAGLPTLITTLRGSHDSAPRVFEALNLQPIGHKDSLSVIYRGIDLANQENADKTSITDEAAHLIVRLAEGYPHFIQQFAFSAFDEDKDGIIDATDVQNGAFAPNGALDQLGKRYFDDMYYVKVWSDDYRKVLHAMTDYLDGWAPRADIIRKSGIKESQVNNALTALRDRNIIIANPQHRGEYRLPTKSFAVWIKAIEAKRIATDSSQGNLMQL
jgi:hypothetical protein